MKTINKYFFLSLVITFTLNINSFSQSLSDKIVEYIEANVSMERFSGSVLVAKKGEILLSKGFGYANLEHDVLNKPETKFRLGSVTKQFTAMAIAQLKEKGLLNFTDPVSKFLPDYPKGNEITIHHLLTHTSGIPDITEFEELESIKKYPTTIQKTVDVFKEKPLEFEPGSKFNYSNSGYLLLGLLIEHLSGVTYEDFLNENIFKPLGMNDSGYDSYTAIIKNRASGYFPGTEGVLHADFIDMTLPHAGGGLYSTVEDLYQWDRSLYNETLLPKNTLDLIFTPNLDNYGYGWRIINQHERKCIRHGGGIEGFRSEVARYVDDDVFVVVLSNYQHSNVQNIANDIAAIVFNQAYEIPKENNTVEVPLDILTSYEGTYEIAPENTLTVSIVDGVLHVAPPGQPLLPLFALSETEFFVKAFEANLTFQKDAAGNVTSLKLKFGKNKVVAKKI